MQRVIVAVIIAASLGGCAHNTEQAYAAAQAQIAREKAAGTYPIRQEPPCKYPCTPEQRASWDRFTQAADALQQVNDEVYVDEVRTYGRHTVLECRSRMLSSTAYRYCLEANKSPRS
jgi:hypothetical protein